jgi:hypothetical protein
MKDKNTILQWIESIADDTLKAKLLKHHDQKFSGELSECDSLATAIMHSFDWHETEDDSEYWASIWSRANKGEIEMK